MGETKPLTAEELAGMEAALTRFRHHDTVVSNDDGMDVTAGDLRRLIAGALSSAPPARQAQDELRARITSELGPLIGPTHDVWDRARRSTLREMLGWIGESAPPSAATEQAQEGECDAGGMTTACRIACNDWSRLSNFHEREGFKAAWDIQAATIAHLRAELEDSQKYRKGNADQARNHLETLRAIRGMNPEADGERMQQFASDACTGYVETHEATVAQLMDRATKAEAELEQVKRERDEAYRDMQTAISMLSEHVEQFHDYEDEPGASSDERNALRHISHHLEGSLISDEGQYRLAHPSPEGELREKLKEIRGLFDSNGYLSCSGDYQLEVISRVDAALTSQEGGK